MKQLNSTLAALTRICGQAQPMIANRQQLLYAENRAQLHVGSVLDAKLDSLHLAIIGPEKLSPSHQSQDAPSHYWGNTFWIAVILIPVLLLMMFYRLLRVKKPARTE